MTVTPSIAIVGAGFSGTLVAAHLLRLARPPLKITLIETEPRRFGRGVAYSATADFHLLNVPAGNMSAFPQDPTHFLRWAQQHEEALCRPPWTSEITAASFVARRAYGDYLCELLAEAERAAVDGICLERRIGTVTGLRSAPPGVLLRLHGGELIPAQRAVIALGNFPPGDPIVEDSSFYGSPHYHRNPWVPGVLSKVLRSESCLLIGSGLTMVDWSLALMQGGYRGTIHVVSRRGLWPRVHRPGYISSFTVDPRHAPHGVRAWLESIRAHIEATGEDWRPLIDALRPSSQQLWQNLPLVERRRFLRHARPQWDCHRHRLAPVIGQTLEGLLASGRMVRHVGRILGYQETHGGVQVHLRVRGQDREERLTVQSVINCSGSECDYRRLQSPLVQALIKQGQIATDPLSLGLAVAPDGALIDQEGCPSLRLFTLGPPQKGTLWETTAVPELRVQALNLATRLLDSIQWSP